MKLSTARQTAIVDSLEIDGSIPNAAEAGKASESTVRRMILRDFKVRAARDQGLAEVKATKDRDSANRLAKAKQAVKDLDAEYDQRWKALCSDYPDLSLEQVRKAKAGLIKAKQDRAHFAGEVARASGVLP